MTMKPVHEWQTPEFDHVWITPAFAAYAIPHMLRLKEEMSLRMLSHWVITTIGEPTNPSAGRGSTRGFSLKDVCLMVAGIKLAKQIGLSHQKTGQCVREISSKWDTLLPVPPDTFIKPGGSIMLNYFDRANAKFLVAEVRMPNFFEASIVEYSELDYYVIGAAEDPVVVLNVTTCVAKAIGYLVMWFNAPPESKKKVGLV
jgi:hypothetical protein